VPLLWLSLAFLLGILLGDWTHLPVSFWLALSLVALTFYLLLWISHRHLGSALPLLQSPNFLSDRLPPSLHTPVPYSMLFVALALGAVRYQLSLPEIGPHHIAWYNDRDGKTTIKALVDDMPDERDAYTNLRVSVEEIRPPDERLFIPIEGTLLARVPPGGGWRYGDEVRLWGYLETPGENEIFSYREYLFHKGIYAQFDCGVNPTSENARMDCARRFGRDQGNPILARVYDLRLRSLDLLYSLYPDPEASLLAGILLGIESGIPEDVAEAFIVTGTSHIIVISGFNFAIIAGLLAYIVRRWLGLGTVPLKLTGQI
jgi:competence protein ComEC